MNRHIIEHLRRFASIPGKEKTWVSELSDDQLYELFLQIRNGDNARAIARHAQTVWKVGRKSSVHSISQGILKFKQRISHLLLFPSSAPEEANAFVSPSVWRRGAWRQVESQKLRCRPLDQDRPSGQSDRKPPLTRC